MTDVRNFRKYLEELSGNNFLRKKLKALERANRKLESSLKELKEEIKLVKKYKAAVPKKKGRKPRTMIQVIAEEMAKKKDGTMKVKDIVKMIKRKKVKTKAQKPYSSVAAALSQNPRFKKVGPGEFKFLGEKAPRKQRKKKS